LMGKLLTLELFVDAISDGLKFISLIFN
jgi:hypothetical protein